MVLLFFGHPHQWFPAAGNGNCRLSLSDYSGIFTVTIIMNIGFRKGIFRLFYKHNNKGWVFNSKKGEVMATQEDQVHLNNIANAIGEIDSYVENINFNQFQREEDIQAAVARNLQMIGDAASLLSDEVKDNYGYIDFNVLIGLKNSIYNIEMERDRHLLWSIIENDLPIIRDDVLTATEEINREEDLSG